MTCSIAKGDLPIEISWKHNNETLNDGLISIVKVNRKISTLSIDSVQAQHAGEYTCVAKNLAGFTSHSTTLYVNGSSFVEFQKRSLPLFLVPPQILPFDFGDVPINTDDIVLVNCLVKKGDFPINITWTLNGIDVQDVVGVSSLNTNKRSNQLSIDSVQAHHAGEYICRATNPAGFTSYAAMLNVNSNLYFIRL